MNVMNLVSSDQRRRKIYFTLNLSDTCRRICAAHLCVERKKKVIFFVAKLSEINDFF